MVPASAVEPGTRSVVRTVTAASDSVSYQLFTKHRAPSGQAHPLRAQLLRWSQVARSGWRSQEREQGCPSIASLRHGHRSPPSLWRSPIPSPNGELVSLSGATSDWACINCRPSRLKMLCSHDWRLTCLPGARACCSRRRTPGSLPAAPGPWSDSRGTVS
jgi:hypothetical protein